MNLIINGEERQITGGATLAQLLEELSLPSQRVAVEVNKEVVRRVDWPSKTVSEGDRIEVVHFVGGG